MALPVAKAEGYSSLPLAVIGHPLAGLKPEEVDQRSSKLFAVVQEMLLGKDETKIEIADNVGVRLHFEDNFEAEEYAYGQHWTDGLPIVLPTPESVHRMLQVAGMGTTGEIGIIPPRLGIASVSAIAANAVMAGCLPEYLPVVVAAIRALIDQRFNLLGIQTTTHPCTPLVIVNGPLAHALHINGKYNCFGQGWRANATIGRAVHLVLQNIGGAIPGLTDKATMGHPGKYSYCIAENEQESPWEPLHVERGFDPGVSTVTVSAAEAPHNINEHFGTSIEGVLTTICGTVAISGQNNISRTGDAFLVISPEHAATFAQGGYSKADVKQYIFDHARVSVRALSPEQLEHMRAISNKGDSYLDSDGMVRVADSANDINIIVAGGPGRHSMWVPTFSLGSRSVTRPIVGEDGTPLKPTVPPKSL